MRTLLFLMAMLCSCYYGYSQTKLTFSYDAAGNQTQRCYGCSAKKAGEKSLETLENLISLVPNPTNGKLTLFLEGEAQEQAKNVTIYSVLGRKLKSVSLDEFSAETPLDLSGEPTGFYLFQIGLQDGNSITKRIIKN